MPFTCVLAPQVAALSFKGPVVAATKGRTVTLNSMATSDESTADMDTNSFSVPKVCGCGLVYDYTFNGPPCIGLPFMCVLSLISSAYMLPTVTVTCEHTPTTCRWAFGVLPRSLLTGHCQYFRSYDLHMNPLGLQPGFKGHVTNINELPHNICLNLS